ncbi:MAG TPA: cytochrome b/b6 domain-containing protein [Alphaproteobacteria bacterium]
MLRNTLSNFGTIAKTFHWVMALMIIGLLGLGLYMTRLDLSPQMFKLYGLHKSFGITVLVLAALRVLWRLSNVHPLPLATHQPSEKILARIAHFLLYVAIFLMPLSGWIMSSAKGFSVSVFGWFTLPNLFKPDEAVAHLFAEIHEYSAYALIILIGLHAAGALKHHMIDRDDTLRRMFPFTKATTLAIALTFLSFGAQAADVPAWTIVKDKSSLTFAGTQMGADFAGSFKEFGGTILFDAAQLDKSKADITINMASVDATSADRTTYLATPDWFDTAKFPQAHFVTDSFAKDKEPDHYMAKGKLTIRDVTLPLDLPFTLTITGDKAEMVGSATIKRLAFGLGKGQWADPGTVGETIKINVKINAVQSPVS